MGMVPVRLVRCSPVRVGSEALARIVASLREQIDAIRGHEAGARRGTDPEDVHDMRTAVRRLRAILRVVRSGFDRAWSATKSNRTSTSGRGGRRPGDRTR